VQDKDNTRWTCRYTNDNEVELLSEKAGISVLLAKVFLSRGISDAGVIKSFLNPSIEDMHDPFLLKDMDKAVKRLEASIRNGETVAIYGDYDVDGITSTSMLYMFLSEHGINTSVYIPDRLDEGYGLSIEGADRIMENNPSLVVTVDCGVTAIEEIEYIKSKGIDVIITDHHECKDSLPDAYAIINPWRKDCDYPFKELSGAGVVYKLINAVCLKMEYGCEYVKYIELAALGTIGDVVPLTGENRIIVSFGLPKIQNTANMGLRTLVGNSGIRDRAVTCSTVGYIIGPRINAAGRMGDAERAVRLFVTEDKDEAYGIVQDLNSENTLRQSIQEKVFKEAAEIIETDELIKNSLVIVVAGKDWHPGIIGIVASKIMEKYNRPSIVISIENNEGRGSCRSMEGFDVFKALSFCGDILIKYGGHELAAGLSLDIGRLDSFRKRINEYAAGIPEQQYMGTMVKVDACLSQKDINMDSVRQLELLGPYGAGNPVPLFVFKNAEISSIRTVGDGKHLKMILDCEGEKIDTIGFNMGDLIERYSVSDRIDAVFSLEINSWNHSQKIQMVLKHIRINKDTEKKNRYLYELDKYIEPGRIKDYNKVNEILAKACFEGDKDIAPDREDLAAVYMYLKKNGDSKHIISDMYAFAQSISCSFRINMNYFKAKKSIEIFEELGLVSSKPLAGDKVAVEVMENKGVKKDLEQSKLFMELQDLKTMVITNIKGGNDLWI
jgi:single-stranded-DNA-specific exonuclease